jgi:hypothetical protein
MGIPTRTLGALSVCLIVALLPPAAHAQEEPLPARVEFPRVRSSDKTLTALIDEAMTGSPTFRKLVAALDATDGVVFVEKGQCRRGVPACLTGRVTLAGRYRFLFVLIGTRRPSADVVAAIGHELQHALEVLAEPSLRSHGAIYLYYVRRGAVPEYPLARETAAAEAAGYAVFRELQQSRSSTQK